MRVPSFDTPLLSPIMFPGLPVPIRPPSPLGAAEESCDHRRNLELLCDTSKNRARLRRAPPLRGRRQATADNRGAGIFLDFRFVLHGLFMKVRYFERELMTSMNKKRA